MVRLAAEEETLSRFPVLTRDDVKSSTALLNPNMPGSTKLRLSWIWHIEPSAAADTPEALQECVSMRSVNNICLNSLQFNVCIGCVLEHSSTGGMKR